MQHAVVGPSTCQISPANTSSGEKMIQLEQKGATPARTQLASPCVVGWQANKEI